MKYSVLVCVLTLTALLAWVAPGLAQPPPPPPPPAADVSSPALGLGGRAGWLKSEDADDTSLYGGAHLRLRLLPILGFEGSIDYRREKFDDNKVEIRSYPILASALLYLIPRGPIQPYLIGGVGWYFNRIEIKGGPDDETRRVGAHVGAGLDVPLTPQVVLNGDIRWIFLDVDSKEVREARRRDLNTDGWLATLGVTFYFR